MPETTEELRQDIDSLRDSMTEKIEHIELRVRSTVDTTVEKVRRTLDLERQVRERPLVALGLAALAGYMLGSFGDSPPRPGEPVRYYDPEGHGRQPGLLADLAGEFGDELSALSSAATAAAAGYLRDTLRDTLPQFEHEYARLRDELAEPRTSTAGRPERPGNAGTADPAEASIAPSVRPLP